MFVICNIFVLIWSDSFSRISTDLLLDIQCGNTDRQVTEEVMLEVSHLTLITQDKLKVLYGF